MKVLWASAMKVCTTGRRPIRSHRSRAAHRNRVCGEFATDETDGVIPLSWVEAAIDRWHAWKAALVNGVEPPAEVIGVDVARGGADRNVYVTLAETRELSVILEVRRRPFAQDTRVTLAEIRRLADRTEATIIMDVIGFGAALVDELREAQYDVRAFDASARARTSRIGVGSCRSRTCGPPAGGRCGNGWIRCPS